MVANVILLHYIFVEITQDKTQPKYLHIKMTANINTYPHTQSLINSKSLNKSMFNKKNTSASQTSRQQSKLCIILYNILQLQLQPPYTTQRLIPLQQRRTQITTKSPIQNYTNESSPFHYLALRDIRIETPIHA